MVNVMNTRIPVIMGSVLLVGDIHDKARAVLPVIDELLSDESLGIERIVMLGDYLNDWDVTSRGEVDDFRFLVDWVGSKPEGMVVMVVGNHDLPYVMDKRDSRWHVVRRGAPGFKPKAYRDVHDLFTQPHMRGVVRAAYPFMTRSGDAWLATHAGVTRSWLEQHDYGDLVYVDRDTYDHGFEPEHELGQVVNGMYERGAWLPLNTVGYARGGYPGDAPSPLWADRSELVDDHVPRVNQIVGHTPVETPTLIVDRHTDRDDSVNGNDDAGERHSYDMLLFMDTMSTMSDGEPIGDSSFVLIHGDEATMSRVPIKDHHPVRNDDGTVRLEPLAKQIINDEQ